MLKASYQPYIFNFNFPGGTSRGVLTHKPSWFIKLWYDTSPEIYGLGEVSIIPDLSPDKAYLIEQNLSAINENPQLFIDNPKLTSGFPAIRFGLETAWIDLQNGGRSILFPSEFTNGNAGIIINGLIWMGKKDQMLQRIKEKIDKGFRCIKIKVGAVDFNEELHLLQFIRQTYDAKTLEIRVDANGAFNSANALIKMEQLAKYQIHSIEQPIKPGQWDNMAKLCKQTPLPIALDEELIGLEDSTQQLAMMKTIIPQYIILKPSLLGGLQQTEQWIQLAKEFDINWWVTSALEGNIGLNAIAQWTFKQKVTMPQGLGTGQVFSNNIDSPLEIRGQKLWYNIQKDWDLKKKIIGKNNSFNTLQTKEVHPPSPLKGEITKANISDTKKKDYTEQTLDNQFNKQPFRTKYNSKTDSLNRDDFPLEGDRGWNEKGWKKTKITLNDETYFLENINWENLQKTNPSSWWQSIAKFLENWADNSPTLTIQTSGSTGTPKRLEIVKKKFWISAQKTCDFFKLNEKSVGLLCLSTNYIAGQMMLVRAMVSGMNLICIEPSGNPVEQLKTPIDFAAMVPMQVNESLNNPDKFNLIKKLIIGGGQVSYKLNESLQKKTVLVYETFGMTETLSHIALRQIAPNKNTDFTTLPGILISSNADDCLSIEYPEMELKKLQTNDRIQITSPNSFVWLGRMDFVINSGGIKISPELIEKQIAYLIKQPFCLIGLPDEKLGEKLMLTIESNAFKTNTLMTQLKKILPAYHCPKTIVFLNSFPTTHTGKISRIELKKQLLSVIL
jgi:o-succinylbenzoate synthase